jgi:hypothetical protein
MRIYALASFFLYDTQERYAESTIGYLRRKFIYWTIKWLRSFAACE